MKRVQISKREDQAPRLDKGRREIGHIPLRRTKATEEAAAEKNDEAGTLGLC